jgi:regulator of sirC expression with transglutaminase-like and TPR domain
MGQRSEAARAFQRYLQLRPDAADAARIREQLDKLK